MTTSISGAFKLIFDNLTLPTQPTPFLKIHDYGLWFIF